MRWTTYLIAVILSGIIPALVAGAAPPARCSPERLRELVRLLDSDDFQTRESAERELNELGQPDIPALKQVLASAASPEVRRRLTRVVSRLTSHERRLRAADERFLALLDGLGQGNAGVLRAISELSNEDFQRLRKTLPRLTDPKLRARAAVIMDYLETRRLRKK